MKTWTHLHIDVDYSPSDPGCRQNFCDRTSFTLKELTPGSRLIYEDSGGLFGAVSVVEASRQKVVLRYGNTDFSLSEDHPGVRMDAGGRDYTNFWLSVWMDWHIFAEDTPSFYREWLPKDKVARLSESDREALAASSSPAAKYLLGRWHYIVMPGGLEGDDLKMAEKLLREAASAGVADAYEILSRMYSFGDTPDDRMDREEGERLRQEALSRGSELARMRYAYNRIVGALNCPKEPEKVVVEVEECLQQSGASEQWYSVLAFAYQVLGQLDKAEAIFKKGIEAGCVNCFCDLAFLCNSQGRREEYVKWMEAGIKAGDASCYILGYDFPQEEYEKLDSRRQYYLTSQLKDRLVAGVNLGEERCAYLLGSNYFCGLLGFPTDMKEAGAWLTRGAALGSSAACELVADILEADNPSDEDRLDAARFRLYALRNGDDGQLEKVQDAYFNGLLDYYEEEIQRYWLPDPDEDDGRWDAYA